MPLSMQRPRGRLPTRSAHAGGHPSVSVGEVIDPMAPGPMTPGPMTPVSGEPTAGSVLTLAGTTLPLPGRARVYACGITPYDVTHLGHAATFVWVDTLARVLRSAGTDVILCQDRK